jgi:alkanesulfonate monooxygenase SsuD/methylene tetrahydromethanopterin reductase-like flavin-dependent oxidoreductase (luciferase family)
LIAIDYEKAIREQQLLKFVIGTPGKVAEHLHDWSKKT